MRLLRNTKFILLTLFAFSLLNSCKSNSDSKTEEETENNTIKDETLSSFMLGGIYFINGYGGIDEVNKMMTDAGYATDQQLVDGYKQIFEFPFQTSQAAGIKNTLREMWDITDKESLLKSIEELKTKEHAYKSWDYARIVNNSSMGFAAGWLSKDEVIDINTSILPLARKDYKNWDDYFTDFEKGRVDWNAEDPDAEVFKELTTTITKGEKSIYNILPLN